MGSYSALRKCIKQPMQLRWSLNQLIAKTVVTAGCQDSSRAGDVSANQSAETGAPTALPLVLQSGKGLLPGLPQMCHVRGTEAWLHYMLPISCSPPVMTSR